MSEVLPFLTERPAIQPARGFELIPALDLFRGEVVRLTRGDFATVESYGTVDEVVDRWSIPEGSRIHVVDLEGSRIGQPAESENVRRLIERGFRVQIGGGIRSEDDARSWLDAGAFRVVIGTIAADAPKLFRAIVDSLGGERVIAAIDLRDGLVRTEGWERSSERPLESIFEMLLESGVSETLVTDIAVDGTMLGPSFDLYRRIVADFPINVIASGGIGLTSDLDGLSRISGVSGAVIGRALHERRFTLGEASRAVSTRALPRRIIPCLDVRDGRVVKGVRFESLRDAGDPVECAMRYEAEGADELVVLDVSATVEERRASQETVRRISENLFIPLTVGGGVRSLEDFRSLLQNGADRVAMNSAAVERPELIADCAREFGVQAVVLAVDARKNRKPSDHHPSYEVVTRGGSSATSLDAAEWCRRAEQLGAGEILLTSIDRDGTADGFEIELLRAVTAAVKIGVIASGGAGKLEHFVSAIERGGASAVLAASLFHDRRLSVGELKEYLKTKGIKVR